MIALFSAKIVYMHARLLYNGRIFSTEQPLVSPGQTGYMTGWGVFSTLRVCEGVLFAYERHYKRMRHDAERLRVPFPFSASELHEQLSRLIDANEAYNATLRVSIVRNRGGAFEGAGIQRDVDLVAFTTDLRDWGSGVRLMYVAEGRQGLSPFAGAKVLSWAQNLNWYEEAHEKGFDEVILLNERGQVSECTSANIFIVEDKRILTPALATSGCLPGVTRALLLEEVRIAGYAIEEAEIMPNQLEGARQVFITSSTRDVLAVFEVEGRKLAQEAGLLASLQSAFLQRRQEYIREHLLSAPTVLR